MKKLLTSVLIAVVAVFGLFAVACSSNKDNDVHVESVSLNQQTATLIEGGDTLELSATVLPADATNKTVTWSSDHPEIATVANGVVTPVAAGTATITVTTADGNKTATCNVTVNELVHVTGVTLDEEELVLEIDGSANLTATVSPSTATNSNVTWESSDTDVVTVENGVVTAVGAGSATVTVTTVDGEHTATCDVEVYHVILDNEDRPALEWTVVAGKSVTFRIYDSFDKGVFGYSSNYAVATIGYPVSAEAFIVNGFNPGTATITISSSDYLVTATTSINITVEQGTDPVEEVTLSSSLTLVVGQETPLSPVISPASAGNYVLSWASSDTSVVTVDKDGVVTVVGKGTAEITLTVSENVAPDAISTVTCVVTVIDGNITNEDETTITLAGNQTKTYIYNYFYGYYNITVSNPNVTMKLNGEVVVSGGLYFLDRGDEFVFVNNSATSVEFVLDLKYLEEDDDDPTPPIGDDYSEVEVGTHTVNATYYDSVVYTLTVEEGESYTITSVDAYISVGTDINWNGEVYGKTFSSEENYTITEAGLYYIQICADVQDATDATFTVEKN